MTDLAIEIRDVRKSYRTGRRTTPVLHGIDLEVRRGESLFLLGPSGSGKTTLLSIIGCVLTPDSGRVVVDGSDVSHLSSRARARFRREHVGFVFQRFHLFDGLSAVDNVRVAFDLLGKPRRRSRALCVELLERVGLGDRLGHAIGQLSMGQRQRVALARALAGDPHLILADEPTASLDARAGRNAIELLAGLVRDLGKTLVVVTHDSRILDVADRLLHLEDGRVVGSSTAGEPVDAVPELVGSGRADT